MQGYLGEGLKDLLNRAANLGEDRVGVGAHHTHDTDHDYQNDGEHNCVLGYILAVCIKEPGNLHPDIQIVYSELRMEP